MNVKAVRSLKESSAGTRNFRQLQEEEFLTDPDNPVKLYGGPVIDTTDRSLVSFSSTARFDPAGYKFDRPLQKDIFHADPYITCENCNYLSFIDVVTVRRMLSLPAAVSAELRLAPEVLPPCIMCKCADKFVVGSHDFAEQVKERRRLEEEKARMEWEAATRIQKSYRRYLRRMYGSALCDMFLANKYLRHVAALKITACARGRLARRIAQTERCLLVIKNSHPLLIRHALRSTLRGPKVFWYKRKLEIDMLYANYLDLVKKTGFIPPRKSVESNIAEISRRVLARQNQLIVLVQRRWRGFMARRIVRYFRTEISRLFQFRVARVMKIQRVYRGHAVRLRIPVLLSEWERTAVMEDYLHSAKDAAMLADKFKSSQQVMGFLGVERAEEKTARYTSRVAAAEHFNMKKMAAFWDSPYADERLGVQVNRLMSIEYGIIQREKDAVNAEHDRRVFIENKIAEHGPRGFGFRGIPTAKPPSNYYYDSVLTAADLGLDEQASSGINISSGMFASVAVTGDTLSSLKSSRSIAFRIYFVHELQHLAALLMERMQHEFSRPGLSKRFKQFNEERFARLRATLKYEERQESALRAKEAAAAGKPVEVISPLILRQRRQSMQLQQQQLQKQQEGPFPVGIDTESGAPTKNNNNINNKEMGSKAPSVKAGKSAVNGMSTELGGAVVKKKREKHLRGNYKYPEHIYFDAMEWLYQDYDV